MEPRKFGILSNREATMATTGVDLRQPDNELQPACTRRPEGLNFVYFKIQMIKSSKRQDDM